MPWDRSALMKSENYYIKKLKKELIAAVLSVTVMAVTLGSSTYAWYVTNNKVEGTTGTISAMANGMVLQIVAGDTPIHGENTWTIAAGKGHEISPSSTDNIVDWYVPATWQGTDVNTYSKPNLDTTGKYTVQNEDFYAYTVSEYTLYTVNSTGLADVYLDNSTTNGPVTITPSDGSSKEWYDKIKGSIRIGVVINDELKVVYAPVAPSMKETGNDVNSTAGWSCVDASMNKTISPTYKHIEGDSLIDQNGGNWGATKEGDYYIKPTGNDQKIAKHVDYNGVSLKIYVWLEGTDSDCVNMNGLDKGTENPTFDVTVSFVGVAWQPR